MKWLLPLLLLSACGTAPAPLPAWLHDPRLTVTYEVTPDAVTCSNRPSPMVPADYPAGYWCHWRCGWVDASHVSQVWLAVHSDGAGHWSATHEVYTGRCYDEDVACPTCNYE